VVSSVADGGAVGPANMIGSLTLNPGVNPIRHRILPLKDDHDDHHDNHAKNNNNNHQLSPASVVVVVKLGSAISSRSEFINMLASVANNNDGIFPTQRIAIQDDKGRYVSCRRKAPNGAALAEYRGSIGAFEQFYLEHNVAKGTFSFRSHNQLYLHYNKTLGTIAFKPKDMGWATWMVHPLGLTRHDNLDSEHVIFVGVVEEGGTTLTVQRTAEGVGLDWKMDFDKIIQTILTDAVPVGGCSMFQHPFTNHQWCIAKYDDDTIGLVVTSEGFPQSLAVECHDDVTLWYKHSKDPKKLARIQDMGLDLERIVGKELAGLMADYDEQYYASIRNTKLSKLEQDLLDLQNKMVQNIQDLQNNVDDVEALTTKAEDLLEQSRLFKKQTKKLPTSWKHATILVGAGLGAGAGALAGWLIGGPGGALILATEGLEIATGAAAVAVLGGSIGANTIVSFWSRKFVKFVFPSGIIQKAVKVII
jgi:hypothetical protein